MRVRLGTPFRGCGSTAECGRAKAETTVRFRSPAPFLSLWCSPDNMPASHAGDHRSEAGQGRQFHCPQSILSDALLWYGSQLGATPGGGSILMAVRKHRSRASAQASIISPLCPGQHWGLRPFSASLQQSVDFFCKEIVAGQHRLEAPLLVEGGWLIVERPQTARRGFLPQPSTLNH